MMAMANLAAPRAVAPSVACAWRATGPVHRGGSTLGATVSGAKAWAMAESMVFAIVLSDHPAW